MSIVDNQNIGWFHRGGMGRMRRGVRNYGGLGSMNASSATSGYGSPPIQAIPTASGNDIGTLASGVNSIVTSIGQGVRGVLSAEAAQNAINAQRNLTTALSPEMITGIILVAGYLLISRK